MRDYNGVDDAPKLHRISLGENQVMGDELLVLLGFVSLSNKDAPESSWVRIRDPASIMG